jgi:pyruvate dehydrogenase E2 component (dihydrolipoamide acetyltransferase)
VTYSFKLPSMSDMTDATVVEWLNSVGEEVSEGEPLVLVETAKAQVELPSPVSGVLTSITAAEDDTIEVGDELGLIAPHAGVDDSSESAG